MEKKAFVKILERAPIQVSKENPGKTRNEKSAVTRKGILEDVQRKTPTKIPRSMFANSRKALRNSGKKQEFSEKKHPKDL